MAQTSSKPAIILTSAPLLPPNAVIGISFSTFCFKRSISVSLPTPQIRANRACVKTFTAPKYSRSLALDARSEKKSVKSASIFFLLPGPTSGPYPSSSPYEPGLLRPSLARPRFRLCRPCHSVNAPCRQSSRVRDCIRSEPGAGTA